MNASRTYFVANEELRKQIKILNERIKNEQNNQGSSQA